jgi:hypothetical protein
MEFKTALDAFKETFRNNIDTMDDGEAAEIFGSTSYVKHFNRPYRLAYRDEYNRIISRNALRDEGEGDFSPGGKKKKLTEEEQRKANFYRNSELYINKEMKDLEKRLIYK